MPACSAPLQALYETCKRASYDLRHYIRVLEYRGLIRDRLDRFVGRDWLFTAIDAFLARERRGYFMLPALPALERPAFSAALISRRGCPHHFVSRLTLSNRIDQVLSNICCQLIARYDLGNDYPSLPLRGTQDSGLLVELLAFAAQAYPTEKILLVIDAIDEREQVPIDSGKPVRPAA